MANTRLYWAIGGFGIIFIIAGLSIAHSFSSPAPREPGPIIPCTNLPGFGAQEKEAANLLHTTTSRMRILAILPAPLKVYGNKSNDYFFYVPGETHQAYFPLVGTRNRVCKETVYTPRSLYWFP